MLISLLWYYLLFLDHLNASNLSNSYQCFESKNFDADQCSQCEFGSECIPTNRNSKNVTCKCIENCYTYGDSIDSREVCSSDGNTFKSQCHLKKHACELKRDISIKYLDKCDPCDGINCLPNQTCIVDENRQSICKCDNNCDQDAFDPICASDGKSYFNECTLKVQACKEGRELKLISKGECSEQVTKACKDANCTNYELCEIDNQNRATCVCQLNCPPIFVPVCGSVGNSMVTYDSICELKKNACQLKQEISILNYGICGQPPTCETTCNFGSICTINSTTFEPHCTCDEKCSMEYQPLCASDGLTYTNHCLLKRKACTTQQDIHQLYNGQCAGCMLHKCEHYSTCKINQTTDKPECVCLFDCDQSELKSICATDKDGNKQIFSSECELKRKRCETKTELKILPDVSNCELCKNVHCKYGAYCSNGKCICPTDCPKELYEPVCSNFGQTFNNECELRKAACKNSKNPSTGTLNYEKLDNHTILFYGECNKQQQTHQQQQQQQHSNEDSKAIIPVSGKSSILISGQMVGNYGTMCNENSCKYGGRCYYDELGKPTCLCLFDCPIQKTDKKQCGNDGRLYLNSCKLQEEICLRQQTIKVLPIKECLTNRNYSICSGSLPEVDKLSGKFIDCNKKSLFFKECSSNYTCLHHRKVVSSIRTLLTFKEQDHFCCSKQEIDQSKLNEFNNLVEDQQNNKCNCNKLGSELPMRCDEKEQCECKSGVESLKCTRCKVGYYGFHKLSQGNKGCLPCSCDKNGRVREDCNQSTGQCICKIDVTGMKCDTCPIGKKLTSTGCIDEALLKVHNKRCASLRCRFGAICKEISPNKSQCVCNHSCRRKFLNEPNYQKRFERSSYHSYADDHYFNHYSFKNTKRDKSKYKYLSRPLCGSDNNTHLNECEMRIHACRSQKKIVKAKDGQCSSSNELNSNSLDSWQSTVTQTPVRRSTLEKDRSFYDLTDEVSNTNNLYTQTESSLNVNQYTNLYEEERPNFNPMFTGRSFIRLSRIEVNDYLKLEIELIPFSDRGIIFYSDQSSKGLGDFISLTLCNGYFEYRFNLGSGISTLRSKEKVQKYVPTLVTVIKDFKKGSLIVNDQEEVSCVAEGNWKNLDLNENFYLGWIRTNYEKVYENLNGVRTGFIGCILKLELGKSDKELKNVDLINSNSVNYDYGSTASIVFTDNNIDIYRKQSKMRILETESINNCSSLTKNKINFCAKYNPCSKSSICVNLVNNTFDCVCPSNLDRCLNIRNEVLTGRQIGQDNQPIDFWSESWIKSKNLLTNINRAFSIEIWFLTREKDGLLIYAQKGRKGDFLSLNIKDRRLEFIFNLGSKIKNFSGVVRIRGDEEIALNYWNQVRIARLDDYATMQINDGKVYSGQAKGNLTELNLDDHFYIGGMSNFNESNPDANLTHCLNGAIQRIIVNGDHFIGSTLLKSSEKANLSSYLGFPCDLKCETISQCMPLLNAYECRTNSE